jgi:23S rRNA (uracil1939-C5)-methyltransferase
VSDARSLRHTAGMPAQSEDVLDGVSRRLRRGCETRCPACAHRALDAAHSEARKGAWLARRLAAWSDRLRPMQAVTGEARWGYRDRVCLRCEWRDNAWQVGMTVKDQVVAIPDCPVHSRRVCDTLQALMPVLPDPARLPLIYFVQSGAQLTLVLKTAISPATTWLDTELQQRLRRCGVEGMWLHLHPSAGKRIFNKPGWLRIWGQARSRDDDGLLYGPASFHQPVAALSRLALRHASLFLAPAAHSVVVDLYCGRGSSLKRWVTAGAHAVGVELDGQSCECAACNVPSATILRGRCIQRLPQLDDWVGSADRARARRLLYLNPPRTGLEPELHEWIGERYRPARIAYLSCSAGTLQRDLSSLGSHGYRVEHIIPYDFFPHTYHVETLALLSH